MFNVSAVQTAIHEAGCDGWLMVDFRGSNVLAQRVLQLPADGHYSRRWAYWIPAKGEPKQLVHRIEPTALAHLPGESLRYLRWQEFEAGLRTLVGSAQTVAMEYSPRNGNPYVSKVDAGTAELVQSFGCRLVSSGDLIQQFEATWTAEQWQQHQRAGQVTDSAFRRVWEFLAESLHSPSGTTERAVQQLILDHFREHHVVTGHAPIVAVNAHSGDPHYETGETPIRNGDWVLVDLWGKLNEPFAVYSDLTRVAFLGEVVPEHHQKVFSIVAAARDAAIDGLRKSIPRGDAVCGWQVDDWCRSVIEQAGYGPAFVHRTGHSIGQETHGNGANIDHLETREERRLLPATCFSIEPGIYLPEFGVRSEVNVFIDWQRQIHVTAGEVQREVQRIVAR
jgi:Xaa-Pro dipeptidase